MNKRKRIIETLREALKEYAERHHTQLGRRATQMLAEMKTDVQLFALYSDDDEVQEFYTLASARRTAKSWRCAGANNVQGPFQTGAVSVHEFFSKVR